MVLVNSGRVQPKTNEQIPAIHHRRPKSIHLQPQLLLRNRETLRRLLESPASGPHMLQHSVTAIVQDQINFGEEVNASYL